MCGVCDGEQGEDDGEKGGDEDEQEDEGDDKGKNSPRVRQIYMGKMQIWMKVCRLPWLLP